MDIAVKIMGALDIFVGILLFFGFDFKIFALILGTLMIVKGGISLIE